MEQIGYIKFGRNCTDYVCVKLEKFGDLWDFGWEFNSNDNDGLGWFASPCKEQAKYKTRHDAIIASIKHAEDFSKECERMGDTHMAIDAMIEKIKKEDLFYQPTLFEI